MNPVNFLTVDLEDYFQVHVFSDVVRFEGWENYESRLERNTHRLLDILHEWRSNCLSNVTNILPPASSLQPPTSPRATFFILGWVAERYPHLIRTIKKEGHEIASHGYNHRLIYHMAPEIFREDVRKSKAILEDTIGEAVIGYRAPSYSITNKSQWAFEVLMDEGFQYDSSIFPIHHDFYGFPEAPRFPFIVSLNGNSNFEFQILHFENAALQRYRTDVLPQTSTPPPLTGRNPKIPSNSINSTDPGHSTPSKQLIEFPISTLRICGQNFPISGGGYFRLFPYSFTKKGLKRINEKGNQPFIFYLHPWELDPDQPRINGISRRSRFRHYVNLHKTESKFKKLLLDFRFSAIADVLNSAPSTQFS